MKTKQSAKNRHSLRANINLTYSTKRKRHGVPGAFGSTCRGLPLMRKQAAHDQLLRINRSLALGSDDPSLLIRKEQLLNFLTK